MTGTEPKELSISFDLQIGDYTIAPSSRDGYVWVTVGGEGGEFEVAKLEAALAKFLAENF